MFGFDSVGFFQGFNEQQEKDERRRVELAQAFNEFKTANPYATGLELQSFVDQLSGGRNYLRGGMPSGEVLRSISEANALRKKQAEEDRERKIASDNMNLALNRQTFATNASKIADDLLLGSDIKLTSSLEDQEKNLAALQRDFTEQMGGSAFLESVGFDPRGLFTVTNLTSLRRAAVKEYIPEALRLIKQSKGQIDSTVLQNTLGVPANLINDVIDIAKKEYGRELSDWEFANETQLIERAVTFMNKGMDITGALTQVTNDSAEAGYTLSEKLKNKIKTEANRIYSERQEDRERSQDEADSLLKTQFVNEVEKNAAVLAAIRRGDEAAIMSAFTVALNQAPDRIKAAILADRDGIVQRLTVQMQQDQRDRLSARVDEWESSTGSRIKEYQTANISAADDFFVKSVPAAQRNMFTQMLGLAASKLAEEYTMNPMNLSMLAEVWNGLDDDAKQNSNFATLYAQGKAALDSVNAQKLSSFVDVQEIQARNREGFVSPTGPVTFDTWLRGISSETQNIMAGLEDRMKQAIAGNDPDAIEAAIDRVLSGNNQFITAQTSSIRLARSKAYGADRWILAGTRPWNEDEVTMLSDMMQGHTQALAELAQKGRDKAEQLRQNQPASTASANANNTGVVTAAPTVPGREDELESEINRRIQTMRAVESDAINKTTNFFGLGARFTDQTDAEFNDRLALGDFLSNGTGDMNDRTTLFSGRDSSGPAGIMNVIANDVELYEKFSEDPIKFMKEYRLPGGSDAGKLWYEIWLERNQGRLANTQ